MPIECKSPSRIRQRAVDISFANATFQIPAGYQDDDDDLLLADDGGTFLNGVNGDITIGTPMPNYASARSSRDVGNRYRTGDINLNRGVSPRRDVEMVMRNDADDESDALGGQMSTEMRRYGTTRVDLRGADNDETKPLKSRNEENVEQRFSPFVQQPPSPRKVVKSSIPVASTSDDAISKRRNKEGERQSSSIRAPGDPTARRQLRGECTNSTSYQHEINMPPRELSPAPSDDMFERMKRDTYLQKGVDLSAHSIKAVDVHPIKISVTGKSKDNQRKLQKYSEEETGVATADDMQSNAPTVADIMVSEKFHDQNPDGDATDIASKESRSNKASSNYENYLVRSDNVKTGVSTLTDSDDNYANTSTNSSRGFGNRLVEYGQKLVDSIGLFSSHPVPISAELSTIPSQKLTSNDSSAPSQPEGHKSNAKSILRPKKSRHDKANELQPAQRNRSASPMRPATKRPLTEQRNNGSREAEPSTKKRRGDGATASPARDCRLGPEITGTGRAQFNENKDKATEKAILIADSDYAENTSVPCIREDPDQVQNDTNFVEGSASSGRVEIYLQESAHVSTLVNNTITETSNTHLQAQQQQDIGSSMKIMTEHTRARTQRLNNPRQPKPLASAQTLPSLKPNTTRTRRPHRRFNQETTALKHEKENNGMYTISHAGKSHSGNIAPAAIAPQKPTLTIPKEFHFHIDDRVDARRHDFEEKLKVWQNRAAEKHPIPDFKSIHAAQEASKAKRRKQAVPVLPAQHVFSTDIRIRERHKFDEARKAREMEAERLLQEERRAEEEEQERQWRDMRKKTVPKANAVPQWYTEAPKKMPRS